jgi:hypothetical protein
MKPNIIMVKITIFIMFLVAIFLVAMFTVIFTSKSDNEKKGITQEVVSLTQLQQNELIDAWNMNNVYTIILSYKDRLKNPYENKGQIYKLRTIYVNDTILDFGDADEISDLKCKRYDEIKTRIVTLSFLNQPCKN